MDVDTNRIFCAISQKKFQDLLRDSAFTDESETAVGVAQELEIGGRFLIHETLTLLVVGSLVLREKLIILIISHLR